MPVHFEFDPKNRVLRVVAKGEVGDAEMLAVNSRIAQRVERLNPSAGITDLSAVKRFTASSKAVQTAARQPRPYPVGIRWFIVAPTDEIFGLARMYELVGSRKRPNLKVVHTLQEALAALGVEHPAFEVVD